MALIKFGAGIVGMAGKIAGTVFARNRSGAYARAWQKPINPRTDRQAAIRALTSIIAGLWAGLTVAQRAAWNLYANGVTVTNRLGESMKLSGFNQFCRSNAARLYAGLLAVSDGPITMNLGEQSDSMVATVTAAANAVSVAFDNTEAWANEDGGAMLLYVGEPKNGNVEFFNGPWRYAGKIEGDADTAPSSPAAITAPFEIGVGQKVFVQGRVCRADGRLSEFFRDSALAG